MSLFFVCLVLHVVAWHVRRPKRHATALLAIFLIPCAVFVLASKGLCPDLPWPDLFAIALLHVALSFAYIQIYPASQADSPSLKMIMLVDKAMPQGLTEAEIRAQFDPNDLFDARIHDLLGAGLVQRQGERLALTRSGESLIKPFLLLRKVLGLPAGKG